MKDREAILSRKIQVTAFAELRSIGGCVPRSAEAPTKPCASPEPCTTPLAALNRLRRFVYAFPSQEGTAKRKLAKRGFHGAGVCPTER